MSEIYNNTTTIKIPKKYHHMLELVEKDIDGYWAYARYGYWFPDMECHFIHEDTQKELSMMLQGIKKCTCKKCEEFLKEAENDPTIWTIKYPVNI